MKTRLTNKGISQVLAESKNDKDRRLKTIAKKV